jgi:prepilin-type N-terminal cleavage/methylation domain-containing protein
MSPVRRARGFTLLEMMIALAILSVITAMSYAALQQMDDWADPQSAASDLSGALALARARAVESGSDVWFIVYEDINRQGTAGQGHGAYFIVEDKRFDFINGSGPPPASGNLLTYANFQPPGNINPLGEQGLLVDYKYLDAYSMSTKPSTVRFGVSGAVQYDPPFTELTPSACSFCSGSPRRGAIVFGADGSARFFDGSGTPVVLGASNIAQRSAALGLISTDQLREYIFAVSAPVGFIGMKKK